MDKHTSPIDPTDSPYATLGHYAQIEAINDPSLSCLRDQIKKVLIPTLIKIFQLKLELNQALSLPSRLYSARNQPDPQAILDQLRSLDQDLSALIRWCESCRNHIDKAFASKEETLKQKVTPHHADTHADTLAKKSFSSALSSQSNPFRKEALHPQHPFSATLKNSQKKWRKWWKMFKNKFRL